MIERDSGIEVHVCAYCDYAIRDEIPLTAPPGWEGDWRPITLDDGPHVPTWHAECAADVDAEHAAQMHPRPHPTKEDQP